MAHCKKNLVDYNNDLNKTWEVVFTDSLLKKNVITIIIIRILQHYNHQPLISITKQLKSTIRITGFFGAFWKQCLIENKIQIATMPKRHYC